MLARDCPSVYPVSSASLPQPAIIWRHGMGDLKMGWIIAGALGAAIVLLAASLHLQFRRDIRAAYSRLENSGSLIAETACGPIEYANLGEGEPVLVVHGIFGGFRSGFRDGPGKPR